MKQLPDDTIHKYFIRLKEQAVKCNFNDTDRELEQQIELMTCNNKIRQYSFQHPGKILQDILNIAKTFETIKIQTEKIQNNSELDKTDDINTVKKENPRFGKNTFSFRGGMSNSTQQSKKCFKCRGQQPHPSFCSTESKFCNKCGRRGHESAVHTIPMPCATTFLSQGRAHCGGGGGGQVVRASPPLSSPIYGRNQNFFSLKKLYIVYKVYIYKIVYILITIQ